MLKKIFDVFYQPVCIVCKEHISNANTLCSNCWGQIDFITEPLCKKCGVPAEQGDYSEYLCDNQCTERGNVYQLSRSAVLYNHVISYLIKQLKYNDNTMIIKMFVNWLMQAGKNIIPKCDFVTPVPMYKTKLIVRKYNQAALLANSLSKKSGKVCIVDLLTKIKDTENQSKLNRYERIRNLDRAFSVKRKFLSKLANKTILLIDDVITTGSTTNECSNMLMQSGAKNVFVLTIAKRLLYK